MSVHSLQTSSEGSILDPDDTLCDVVDDREQVSLCYVAVICNCGPYWSWGIAGTLIVLCANPGFVPSTVGTFLWSKPFSNPQQVNVNLLLPVSMAVWAWNS